MEHLLEMPGRYGKNLFQLRFCELEQLEQMALFQEKTLINEHEIEFQNWNKPSIRGPCRTPSVRPPTADCRPQGGHPCIERMRDAHGRSNALRPLQRRFKARKKPEGYTSTPRAYNILERKIQRPISPSRLLL